jgi:hypothetical protein
MAKGNLTLRDLFPEYPDNPAKAYAIEPYDAFE